ncbi:UNVERIFIED_CONTAM: hypothetical protein FKN15_023564 [Acipenser sinensis]
MHNNDLSARLPLSPPARLPAWPGFTGVIALAVDRSRSAVDCVSTRNLSQRLLLLLGSFLRSEQITTPEEEEEWIERIDP